MSQLIKKNISTITLKKSIIRIKKFLDPINRPINIDCINNIFYINHNGENESIKIEPGQ